MKSVFKRYEFKYLITPEQYERIKKDTADYMLPDPYGRSTIQSLYYDTPDSRLIRRSIEKPDYKEKMRVRSYGIANAESTVFVELKKKADKVVFKRRISLPYKYVKEFINEKKHVSGQIANEINYFTKVYPSLRPAMLLIYDREAFYSEKYSDLRITFDTNVRFRDYDLDLSSGYHGEQIAKDGILMEIKSSSAMPLQLVHLLSELKVYKRSFSKYGTAYSIILQRKMKSLEDNHNG